MTNRRFSFAHIGVVFSCLMFSVAYVDVAAAANGCKVQGAANNPRPCAIPFFIQLDGDGAEATIARNGPLSYFARCIIDDSGSDRIRIFMTSSVSGWFEEDEGGPLAAGAEVQVFSESATTGEQEYDNDIDEGSGVAPGGFYLTIDGEMLGLGLNILDHDCTVIGSAVAITLND